MSNILVVDDEIEISNIIKDILSAHDHNVTLCHDGNTASNVLKAQNFDLIILDTFLPEKNGLELTYLIRHELPEDKRNTPIIGITGGNGLLNPLQTEQKIRDFLDLTLQKPLNYKALANQVEKLTTAA